jgi:hypothetical protein
LRKLSPNAEKAWHQNKGAKRRVVIKDVDMALPPFDSHFGGRILDGRRRIGDAVSGEKGSREAPIGRRISPSQSAR